LTRPRLSVHHSVHFFKEWRGGTGQHPAAAQDIQGLGQRRPQAECEGPCPVVRGRALPHRMARGRQAASRLRWRHPAEALEAQKRKRL
jgi:hypothetical protein